jgi:hypothetical protein
MEAIRNTPGELYFGTGSRRVPTVKCVVMVSFFVRVGIAIQAPVGHQKPLEAKLELIDPGIPRTEGSEDRFLDLIALVLHKSIFVGFNAGRVDFLGFAKPAFLNGRQKLAPRTGRSSAILACGPLHLTCPRNPSRLLLARPFREKPF